MTSDYPFLKTRIPVSEELTNRCLNIAEIRNNNRSAWLIAASLLLLISINISAYMFALRQEKPVSSTYLINSASYE
jgi:hypothetical protein